ncbi:MAG TPA: oxygen-independent coproporphyrinogen III oxidase [Fimbriiglobus sp.]|jgi:oxygen-independent coproporphyrinogen-3 oxidase|nr:oxygen-independent coproporphyrinogen III oxidase [Fimbriiglobus sp.]
MTPFDLTPEQRAVYRRYAELALPRHTSYPTAPVWSDRFGADEYRDALHRSADAGRPLSLYVHVPFCERLCYYCACTKEIVPAARRRANDPSAAYLRALAGEADRVAEAVGPGEVRQVHLGGGTPTFLAPDQLGRLWAILADRFHVAPEAEMAVEIDPRATTAKHLATLRALGFNRVSLGVQDFDPRVQTAINRVQPVELVAEAVGRCRELGFESVNFDLIYGLPYQTPESMAATLEKVLDLGPDRVAFYRLAMIPEMFRWQNTFRRADLPAGEAALELNLLAVNRFLAAGYEFVGLDHFARPTEALAAAVRDGSVRRTFQGMTTGRQLDVIGLGPSAISLLDDAFAQNVKESGPWRSALGRDLATHRGLRLSPDDRVRRELLQELYGRGEIDTAAFEAAHGIAFADYFADELRRLAELEADGLVEVDGSAVRLTPVLGRLLVRVVAAVFDAYLPADSYREGLPAQLASKVG